jgi:hypothetical protein
MADPRRFPNLTPADAQVAELMFEFVQFLLDDDANLTPAGNLTGAARQQLRTRVTELFTAEEAGSAALGAVTTGGTPTTTIHTNASDEAAEEA